ncbi:F-actin-capping protein subunit alpha [Serendipita sp. 407]|nr:F-actin-capping protein subunit alpha [Serendipita sp. 400]KAG9056309.1 F-actin-capping protein subunit alpha [Serendipita sp. 407]
MNPQQRVAAAAKLLVQSPPGEINDCLTDIRVIIDDDNRLQQGIDQALREYNVSQFITVQAPDEDHQVIISDAGRIGTSEEDRFLDPRSKKSFIFDHLRLETSDVREEEIDQEYEPFRSALDSAAQEYIADHFSDGVASVFLRESGKLAIQLVANRYNPPNFWSGRWRSKYEIDLDAKTVTGTVSVTVHYYENGNVQLTTEHVPVLSLPPSSPSPQAAKQLLLQIAEQENTFQTALSDTYHDLGEKRFKALRRALPMTRNKIDWDKVTGYKLGAELSAGRGGFGS